MWPQPASAGCVSSSISCPLGGILSLSHSTSPSPAGMQLCLHLRQFLQKRLPPSPVPGEWLIWLEPHRAQATCWTWEHENEGVAGDETRETSRGQTQGKLLCGQQSRGEKDSRRGRWSVVDCSCKPQRRGRLKRFPTAQSAPHIHGSSPLWIKGFQEVTLSLLSTY